MSMSGHTGACNSHVHLLKAWNNQLQNKTEKRRGCIHVDDMMSYSTVWLCWALTCDAIVDREVDAVLHKLVVHCRRWCEMWSLLCRKTHAASPVFNVPSYNTVDKVWPLRTSTHLLFRGKLADERPVLLMCCSFFTYFPLLPSCSKLLNLFKISWPITHQHTDKKEPQLEMTLWTMVEYLAAIHCVQCYYRQGTWTDILCSRHTI